MPSSGPSDSLTPGEVLWLWDRLYRRDEGASRLMEPKGAELAERFLLGLDNQGVAVFVAVDPSSKDLERFSGRNVRIAYVNVHIKGKRTRMICVACQESKLRQVFAELVCSIHRRLSQGRSGDKAVQDAVIEFKRLLEGGGMSDLTREEAAGLAGELLVLNRLCEIDRGAWQAWEGPLGGEHDFHRSGRSIEVKSSTRRAASGVEINGLQQLAAPVGGLLLVHQILIPDSGGDVSVPVLVERAESLVSDREALFERLSAVGFSVASADVWGVHRFSNGGSRVFRVDDGFPRLTPDRFASGRPDPGISTVTYTLALDAISPWEVDQAEEQEVLREFVDG